MTDLVSAVNARTRPSHSNGTSAPDGQLFAWRYPRLYTATTTSTRQLGRSRVRSARSRNRSAAWSYDLHQWHAYQSSRPGADVAALDAELAARLAAGPDFAGYHAGSDYSEPPLHQLDPAGKQQVLRAFDECRRWLYRNRKPRAQAVSRAYREVLALLLNIAGRYGRVYPSRASIAKLCCCSLRTVDNALAWLRTWGFLSWKRRIKRVPTALGVMVRQTSNGYKLMLSGLSAIGASVFSRGAKRNHSAPSSSQRTTPRYNAAHNPTPSS